MAVGGAVEGVEHFGDNDLYVLLGGHLKEQIQSLFFESFVFALQALDYDNLILIKQLRFSLE